MQGTVSIVSADKWEETEQNPNVLTGLCNDQVDDIVVLII